MKTLVLLLVSCLSTFVFSQQIPDHLEKLASVNDHENEDDYFLQQREMMIRHKLDLNKTDQSELTQFALLSPQQIDNFFAYRKLFGPFLNIYELQAIPAWDVATIHTI